MTLSDGDLYSLVVRLKTGLGLFYGERAMMGLIKAEGHWAPRWKVRHIIRQIDPEGIRTRWALLNISLVTRMLKPNFGSQH